MAGGQQAGANAGLDSKEAVPPFLGLAASMHAPKTALQTGLTPTQTVTPPISPTVENFASKFQSESVKSRMKGTLTMDESLPQSQDSVKMYSNPHIAWLFGSTEASEKVSGPADDHRAPTTNGSQSNQTALVQPAESSGENEKSNPTTMATRPHQQKPAEPSGESKTSAMHPKDPAGHVDEGGRSSPSEAPANLGDSLQPMDLSEPNVEASDSSASELYLTDTGMEKRKKNSFGSSSSQQIRKVDTAIRHATFAFIKLWVEQTPKFNVTTRLQKILQKSDPKSDSDIDTMTGKLLAAIEYPDTTVGPTESSDQDSDLQLKRNTHTTDTWISIWMRSEPSASPQGNIQTEEESTVGSPEERQHVPSVKNKPTVQSKPAPAQEQTPEHMTDSVSTIQPKAEIFPMTPITGRRVWTKQTQHKEDIKPKEGQQTPSMEATSCPLAEPTEKLHHHVTAQQAQISTSSRPTEQPKIAATPTKSRDARRGQRGKGGVKKPTSRKPAKSSKSEVNVFTPIGANLTPVEPVGWVDWVDRTTPIMTAPQTPTEDKYDDCDSDIPYQSPGYAKSDMGSDMVAPIAPATKSKFLNNGIMENQMGEMTAQTSAVTAQPSKVTEPIRRQQSMGEWQVDGSPTKPTLVLRRTHDKVNANTPKVACYMRPATQADMSQVTAIYNWEVENGVQTLSEKLTISAFTKILEKAQHFKMPFIVVVKGSYPGPKAVGAETILGFGYVWPWLPGWCLAGGTEDVGAMSVWLQVYVHPTYRDNRIGSCLIDKLTTLCVPNDQEDGCFFANPDNDAVYGGPSVRAYHKLYMQCLEPNVKFTRAGYFRSPGIGNADAEDVMASPERLKHILAKPEREIRWSQSHKEKSSHFKSRNGGVQYFLDSTVYAYDGYLQIEQHATASGW